jgi:arabinan endo-1,5-alpha-L-arabinosidase
MRAPLSLTLCLLSLLATAQEVENPVWATNWPDPTIWQAENGMYYCLATNPRRMLHSTDLFHWAIDDRSPIDTASWTAIQGISRHFWAPDVASVGGQRMLYLTLYNSAEDSNIGVLQEYAPGQFRYVGIITSSKDTGIHDTIDPEVVTDPKTGRVWLFFGSVGGIHRIELDKDGRALKPGATYEHVAGLKVEQCPDRSKVFEGSYLHRHGKYWYLFVSSGFFGDHTYKLQVGRAKRLTDTFLDREGRPMKDGFATTVLQSNEGDRFYGPGHCGEIFKGQDGQEYIFYHCHVQGSRRPSSRPLFLSPIKWDKEGWPYVEKI